MDAPTLETDRLVLRPFVDADAPLLADGIFADPEVIANLPEAPETPDEQMDCTWLYIHDYRDRWGSHGWGGWAVTARDPALARAGTFLGFAASRRRISMARGRSLAKASASPSGERAS